MFKLVIECTKDIDELHIDFSDGTSMITSKPESKNKNKSKKMPKSNNQDEYLDISEDYTVSTEKIEKPEIPEIKRDTKISDNLKNLEV